MPTPSERLLASLALDLASCIVGLRNAVSTIAESQKNPSLITKIQNDLDYTNESINKFISEMKDFEVQ